MRKTGLTVVGIVWVILFYFTIISAGKAFNTELQLPPTSDLEQSQYRLVLITQELETPFWDKVSAGALEQAQKEGASLEVWGSYGNNQEQFLQKIEIALYSKVDGIIVQGLDTEEFKKLTKIKAASYGIPVITVANDVPMEESLRKTYVGSDQYAAGNLIASQLLSDMGPQGNVILMSDNSGQHYQKQRLNGIQDVLKNYPNVRTVYAETPDTREQVIAVTKDLMNRVPDVNAFIAVNANMAGAMIEEIGRRSRVEPYYIYSFDDGAESLPLFRQGKLDGIIEQSPETMGKISVNRIIQWLSDEKVLLNMNGYFTNIRMVKAMGRDE